jgi:hypothetical protein
MGRRVAMSHARFARPTIAAIPDSRAYDVPIQLHDAV